MGPGSGPACDLRLNTTLTEDERRRFQDPAVIRRLLRDRAHRRDRGHVGGPAEGERVRRELPAARGLSDHPGQPARRPGPRRDRSIPTLRAFPIPVDIVDVFRPPAEAPGFARQAVAIGARALWLQLRIVNFEAAEIAAAAGLDVVMDRCLKMEHGRFNGTLHWGGMNTEIISARKASRGSEMIAARSPLASEAGGPGHRARTVPTSYLGP